MAFRAAWGSSETELTAITTAAQRKGVTLPQARILAAIGLTLAAVSGCQSASVALNPNALRSLSWHQTLIGTCADDLPVAVVVVNAGGVMVGSTVVTNGTSTAAVPAPVASGTNPDLAAAAPSGSPGACSISTVVPVSQSSSRYWVGVTLHTTVLIPPPNGGGGLGSVYGPFLSLNGILTPPLGQ